LGKALYSAGNLEAAIRIFRSGLLIDPMCAELYYRLGLALGRNGDQAAASQAIALAGKLQPRFVSDPPDSAAPPNRSGSF
jgi:Flp pilus assembly protein TadD